MAPTTAENDLKEKLKWLIFGRFIFVLLLLGSTIVLHSNIGTIPPPKSLLALYRLIGVMFLFSVLYYIVFRITEKNLWHAYTQIIIDTVFVTFIIYVTGSFSSVFSFLYLVVIIYAGILLYRNGSFVMAVLGSVQYFIMVEMEYRGIIKPLFMTEDIPGPEFSSEQILYKVLITAGTCFAVAFLSSVLSEQARKSKNELLEMENHVKHVEKMAYMGQMAANLAHEIKNPLASLAGSIQLLREDIDYDPARDKLMQIVLRETERLSSLATKFLFFARPPTGKYEEIELDRTLADIISFIEKDHSIVGRIDIISELASGIQIEMDPMHLRQIVLNLILNAAESIEEKGKIELKMYPEKNNFVEIMIKDSGCGISNEHINSIFDPFFTTKANGTGLGLSIVHNILETYDSRLEVDSQPQQGTTIRFKLKRI